MRIVASTVLAITLLSSSVARAEREWYGWQILLADVVSWSLIASNSSGAGGVGLLGYLLGGPVIHFAHGEAADGVADLGARVFLPLAGGALAAQAAPCHDCEAPSVLAVGGVLGGAALAMLADYVLLSTKERIVVAPERGGGVVSVAGRF